MKVAIAGYGVEGEVNYKYWSAQGADITIFDESETPSRELPEGVKTVLGESAFQKMQGFDLVIRTAGLNPARIHTDGKIWSATNEFFAKCSAPIIGVTGTKGKGTTCSLIAEILKAAGKTVHLLGNIGTPALEILPNIAAEDIVVFELSSFQLWDVEKSPETAVILMIAEDHLNVHEGMDDYVNAKANIGVHQQSDDLMIYHPTNTLSAKAASKSPARKVCYMSVEGANIDGDSITINGDIICAADEVGLLGAHNLENICAAVTAAWRYTQNVDAIRRAVTSFKGLPHRLEFVRELDGVAYYNDSYSPNPVSTQAALKAFRQPVVLIAGGFFRKGTMFGDLAADIKQYSVKHVELVGETASMIASELDAVGYTNYSVNEGELDGAVEHARQSADPGDVVLLSPGCPSFDMFKNFEERGNVFKQIIQELK